MRKIAVFTGTRAEYGLLYWILKHLRADESCHLHLLVGGMHLSNEFGNTIRQIEADGFNVHECFNYLVASDQPEAISNSIALATISAGSYLSREKPDLLVLLGDRYEALAVAQAAMVARVPIAHLHGGESTEGVIDEAIRHAITKMSHLHFTSTAEYRERVTQLGEQPERVFNFGAPGIDNIFGLELLDEVQTRNELGIFDQRPYIVFTYHPLTLRDDDQSETFAQLLSFLVEGTNYHIVMTYPNSDTHGRKLIEKLELINSQYPGKIHSHKSLGSKKYLSAIKWCKAVVGNSSSGIIEAPSFKVPTLDVGDRQKGRIKSASTLSCSDNLSEFREAFKTVTSSTFVEMCKKVENPYGTSGASEKIASLLANYDLTDILNKKFYRRGV